MHSDFVNKFVKLLSKKLTNWHEISKNHPIKVFNITLTNPKLNLVVKDNKSNNISMK